MPPSSSPPAAPLRPAVFFDRDGTLIEEEHYLSDPERVRLRAGAVAAVRRARALGAAVLAVTNQSGIGRGMYTEADYERVRARVDALFAEAGAPLDATYHCPHTPDAGCACRKPGIALYQQSASEHALDLAGSLYVGDRLRDVQPAARFGGLGVLVPTAETPFGELQRAEAEFRVSTTLPAAVERFAVRVATARGDAGDAGA